MRRVFHLASIRLQHSLRLVLRLRLRIVFVGNLRLGERHARPRSMHLQLRGDQHQRHELKLRGAHFSSYGSSHASSRHFRCCVG